MLIMSALLLGRLFYLQVVNTDYYQVRAENNRINVTPILPNRGLIYDSKGTVLAKNYSSYALELLPASTDDHDRVISALADLVVISTEDRRRIEAILGGVVLMFIKTPIDIKSVIAAAMWGLTWPIVEAVLAKNYSRIGFK